MQNTFEMPPIRTNSKGEERRVGFEFEFTGVNLRRSAELVQRLVGGEIETENYFRHKVVGGKFGDFQIESDSSLMTQRKWERYYPMLESLDRDFRAKYSATIDKWMESLMEDFIPHEIVTPPIPLSQLRLVEDLRELLQVAGARGTKSHFYSAYGLQFNPEMPDFEVATLLAFQRAFFLLYDRMMATEEVPFIRKALPFINPFPQAYVALVLNSDYRPTLPEFMHDYLRHNPTRNRALDWLPLFAYLDKDLTYSYPVEVELIKPRPTLHYRLPSSLIDDPRWTIREQWNKWVEVERLASEPDTIEQMSSEWRRHHGPLQFMGDVRWAKRSGELLHGRA